MIDNIAVLGAGAWGTALALLLARQGHQVHLWSPVSEHMRTMQKERMNTHYLPGETFPDNLIVHTELSEALKNTDNQLILIAVPSHAFISCLELIKPYLKNKLKILSTTKGLLPTEEIFFSKVLNQTLEKSYDFAMLSGPSFAKEVAKNSPTAVNIASESQEFALELKKLFETDHFKIILSNDLIGMQLCSAVKNVLAIAVGMSDGLGYGINTQAALMTCGLNEMTQLGLALGAKNSTFTSLAGIGDLILTCSDNKSRNRRFGLALAKGENSTEAQKKIAQTVEGFHNAKQVYDLSIKYDLNLKIIKIIYQILYDNQSPESIINFL